MASMIRNKYGRAIVNAELDGCNGSSEVCWIENDGFNAPHWAAFEIVPWQDARWVWIGSKYTEDEAIEKATRSLEYSLIRCGLV